MAWCRTCETIQRRSLSSLQLERGVGRFQVLQLVILCVILWIHLYFFELTAPKSVIATGVPSRWANDEKISLKNWPEWATFIGISGTKWTTEKSIKVSWYDGGKPPRKLAGFEKDEEQLLEVVVYLLEN